MPANPFGPCPGCRRWECVHWARGTGRPCVTYTDTDQAAASADVRKVDAAFAALGVSDPLARGLAKAGLGLVYRALGQPAPPALASAEPDIKEGVRTLRDELRAAMRRGR